MVNVSIWGVKGSTCTDRILITAAELGIPVDFHPIDFSTGQHKSAEHVARQPFGKVPAAEVDGFPFYESRAISRVLARSSPAGEQLFPSSDIKRVAVFEQWASLEAGTITPVLEKVVSERVFKPIFRGLPADDAVVKKAVEDGQTAFQVMDRQLGSNQFVAGDFSLVDVFLSTYFGHFVTTAEGKQVLSQHSNIAAWWDRIAARPSYQKVKAEKTF